MLNLTPPTNLFPSYLNDDMIETVLRLADLDQRMTPTQVPRSILKNSDNENRLNDEEIIKQDFKRRYLDTVCIYKPS